MCIKNVRLEENHSMQFKHLLFTINFLLNLLLASFAQEPTLLEHGGGVRTVAFSPTNHQLVASAGESHVIKLWNLKNGKVRTLRGHTDVINAIAFSPDGRLLASVSDDGIIKLWNVHNQKNIATLREGTHFRTVAFSPDGKLLATGGGPHVKLWDVGRRVEIATFRHDTGVWSVAFSPDGEFLAVGDGSSEGPGTVKVWDVKSRQVVVSLDANPKYVEAVEFSLDNRYLTGSGWDGHLKIWEVSNWELMQIIPDTGSYDVALSPDGKKIASITRGHVSLWQVGLWDVESGVQVTSLSELNGWIHPVDFSPDGTAIAAGNEDGFVRIWNVERHLQFDITTILSNEDLTTAAENIPEPMPPSADVRHFFQLDPYYEQWINVGGLPVIASAKVNPYALKEAAWVILKMIGHRPDVLRAMVKNKARFSVIPYTEIITEIPEYRSDPSPDFIIFHVRGQVRGGGATVSASEESILSYPGATETFVRGFSVPIHELAHAIHLLGFNTLDSTFDERLRITYEAAMKKGLWQGTYASSNRSEYWAEGTHAWFFPNSSVDRQSHFGNTRQALKEYDPELVTLLTEVYGDREWRYTPVATRTHLPHLQGFNPQDSPTFQWWPGLEALDQQLRDPNSDGNGRWVDLKSYNPSELPRLTKSNPINDFSTTIFVNLTETDLLLYEVNSDGIEYFTNRYGPDEVRGASARINQVYLVKDADGKNIAAFQAVEETGRALVGATPRQTPEEQPSLTVDVDADGRVNKADLLHVVNALGKKATAKTRTDVNADGIVDVADLLLVIEHLDEPKDAAAPVKREILTALNPAALSAHLDILRAQNDGSLAYVHAISFLESLLAAAKPERTLLLVNYPNPFNPETWIPYQLSEPAEVTLHIYAIEGTLIRRLTLGHQPVGMYHSKSHAAYWDGRNEVGEPVASGIYFYTLTAGEFTATRKMLILK